MHVLNVEEIQEVSGGVTEKIVPAAFISVSSSRRGVRLLLLRSKALTKRFKVI